jgi:hypothetical protein
MTGINSAVTGKFSDPPVIMIGITSRFISIYQYCLENGIFGVPLLYLVQRDRGDNSKFNTPVILEEVR